VTTCAAMSHAPPEARNVDIAWQHIANSQLAAISPGMRTGSAACYGYARSKGGKSVKSNSGATATAHLVSRGKDCDILI